MISPYLKIAADNNKELLSFRPIPKDTLKSLREFYRVGLTYTSNALEGNSLTETETKVVIEDGLTINGKPLRDVYEAVGHAKAYDHIHKLAKNKTLEESDILMLHRLFYQQIDADKAGFYRKVPVVISGSRYPVTPHLKIRAEMRKFVAWFNKNESRMNPVEFAAQVHKKFVFIHPFVSTRATALSCAFPRWKVPLPKRRVLLKAIPFSKLTASTFPATKKSCALSTGARANP